MKSLSTKNIVVICALCTGLLAMPASATVIVYQTDAELFAQADVVAVAQVWRAEASLVESSVYTDYELEFTETLKGSFPRGSFTLMRTMGGETEDGEGTYLAGAPHPPVQSTVIVFLTKQANGDYTLTGFTLGHYELRYETKLGRFMAHRDVDAVDMVYASPTRDGAMRRATVPADRLATQVLEELRSMAGGQR